MKKAKFFLLAGLGLCVNNAVFADAADTLISFSTTADRYADGTAVADGEWYALCWSQDGIFDGIKADCTPYDAQDKVLMMAPLAKNGRCPFTVFEVDSKVAPKSGKYCVIMLDTREGGVPSAAKEGTREPETVKLAIASANYTVSGVGPSGGVAQVAPKDAGWAVVDANPAKPAKIAAFEVGDADVRIDVVDMCPGVRYNVQMGQDVKDITTYDLPTDGKAETATFFIGKDKAKFFKLVREPLSK